MTHLHMKNNNGVCTQITYHPLPCTLGRSLPEVHKGSFKILCNILKTSLESRRDILRCSSKLENFLLTTDIDITYQEGSSQKKHDKSPNCTVNCIEHETKYLISTHFAKSEVKQSFKFVKYSYRGLP